MNKEVLVSSMESFYPPFQELPYYQNLIKGVFSKEDTLKAQLQDWARAIGSKGLRVIQTQALSDGLMNGTVSAEWHHKLYDIIMDEEGRLGAPSHLIVKYFQISLRTSIHQQET